VAACCHGAKCGQAPASRCPASYVVDSAARFLSGFPQGWQEVGYVEFRNIDIAYRYADGDVTRMPGLADELLRLRPDVFVTGNVAGTRAIKRVTATIPIVNVGLTDPEGFGFIESMARPGGQVLAYCSPWTACPRNCCSSSSKCCRMPLGSDYW
jgi:hypothetical protein